jgi:hypothetical protein
MVLIVLRLINIETKSRNPNWDVFNNRQIKFPEYRRHFKDYLDKHLKPEDLTSGPDGSTALHVVSDQGFHDRFQMFI